MFKQHKLKVDIQNFVIFILFFPINSYKYKHLKKITIIINTIRTFDVVVTQFINILCHKHYNSKYYFQLR